jgi:hypothetical protein
MGISGILEKVIGVLAIVAFFLNVIAAGTG